MNRFDNTDELTSSEIARGLLDLFEELRAEEINEALAKNVPLETLEFFSLHAEEFADSADLDDETRKRIPNLLLLGYLLRVLEERLLPGGETYDA